MLSSFLPRRWADHPPTSYPDYTQPSTRTQIRGGAWLGMAGSGTARQGTKKLTEVSILLDGAEIADRTLTSRWSYGYLRPGFGQARPGSARITAEVPYTSTWLDEHTARARTIGQTLEIWADSRLQWAGTITEPDEKLERRMRRITLQANDILAGVLATTVTLTSVPQERTDQRIARILRAAGITDDQMDLQRGGVNCAAPPEGTLKGRVGELLRRTVLSEGGLLAVAPTTDGQHMRIRFYGRPVGRSALVAISDHTPNAPEDLTPIREPLLRHETAELLSVVEVEDATGTIHTRAVGDAAYGQRRWAPKTYLSAEDATDLAEWLISSFGRPLERWRNLEVDLTHEQPAARALALQVTVGTPIELRLDAEASLGVVRGIRGAIVARKNRIPRITFGWEVLPPLVTQFWLVGISALNEETRLGSGDVNLTGAPIGRYKWTLNDVVTAARFNDGIAAQRVAVYADAIARDTAEPMPHRGMTCRMLDDQTDRIYDGSQWIVTATWTGTGTAPTPDPTPEPDPDPPETPTHTFDFVSGQSGSTIGLNTNFGSIRAGSTATYTTPTGRSVTVVMLRTLNGALVLTLTGTTGASDTASFPTRIEVERQGETAVFTTPSPDNIRAISAGIRRDYTRESGNLATVFSNGFPSTARLYY